MYVDILIYPKQLYPQAYSVNKYYDFRTMMTRYYTKDIAIVLTVILTNCHQIFGKIHESCVFCRPDHVGVMFSPFVSINDRRTNNRYSISDLLPLVTKIASEFKTLGVLIPYKTELDSILYEIPTAIAIWNANKSHLLHSGPLKAVLFCRADSPAIVERVQEAIQAANKIYPNTLTELVLDISVGDLEWRPFRNSLLAWKTLIPRKHFKLSVAFETDEFQLALEKLDNKLASYIITSFDLIDSVYFYFIDVSVDRSLPVKGYVKTKLDLVKDLSAFVKRSVKSTHSLSFGVMGSWSDTTEEGEIDYSKLVEFWKAMEEGGKSQGFNVLLMEAFDNFFQNTPHECGYGWWRLVQNSSYTSTVDFVFEDKFSLAAREKTKTPSWIISQLERDAEEFDRENIKVEFMPLAGLFYTNDFLSSKDATFKVLLETLASRFSQIHIQQNLDLEAETNRMIISLPVTVATRNSRLLSSPLQLSICLHLSTDEHDAMTRNILRANEIFAGTVNKVMFTILQNSHSQQFIVDNLRTNLQTNTSVNAIQIGYYDNVNFCDRIGLENEYETKAILEKVDFFYFMYFPGVSSTLSGYQYGVDRVLLQTISLFESCKHRIATFLPSKSVEFGAGYCSPSQSAKYDFWSVILFWKGINAWATKSNTQVILYYPFDLADNEAFASVCGWWSVRLSTAIGNNSTIIEDKRTVVLEQLQKTIVKFNSDEPNTKWVTPTVLSTFLVSFVLLAICFLTKRCIKAKSKIQNDETMVKEICSDGYIIPLGDTAFDPTSSTKIGTGYFGTVYKCYMPEFRTEVAVKTAYITNGNRGEVKFSVASLLAEIKVMSSLGQHENILRMLGASVGENVFLVTEFCENGSLLSYLRRKSLETELPSNYELLNFCMEIAHGMWYLDQKKFIHGDVAARNVLLDGNKNCKICDFGLSRKLGHYEKYTKKGEEPLPWRWMAPEALDRKEFSLKSDVWSMGVTFWEVYTLGKVPFPDVTWDGAFCKRLEEGFRLSKPVLADDIVYRMMSKCWQLESENRPSSKELYDQWKEMKCSEYAILWCG